MRMGLAFGAYFGVIIILGWLSNELGVTQAVLAVPEVNEPGGGSLLDTILAPFKWAFNAVAGYAQIATFQAQGLPPMVVVMLFYPLQVVYIYFVYRAIRSGA